MLAGILTAAAGCSNSAPPCASDDARAKHDAVCGYGSEYPDEQPPDPLEADAGANKEVEVGESVTMLGWASTSSATATWDFADGTTATGLEVEHSWSEAGHYTVVLEVTDELDRSDTDSATITVHHPLSDDPISWSSTIAADSRQVFVVNPEADSVGVISLADRSLTEIEVCDHPRTLALAHDEATVAVACEDDDILTLIDVATLEVRDTVNLGDTSRPYGVAASEDGWWVTLQATGSLAHVTGVTAEVRALGPDPRGVAVHGDQVVASRFRSTDERGLIYVLDGDDIELPIDDRPDSDTTSGGVPGLIDQVAFTPDGNTILVPAVQSNVLRGGYFGTEGLTFETTVRAVLSRVDTETGEDLSDRKIFDERGRAIAAIPSPLGNLLFVLHPGTRSVTVLDAYTGDVSGSILDIGHSPAGLALSPTGSTLFVHTWLDREVHAYDLSDPFFADAAEWTAPTLTTEPLDADVLLGKQLFYDSQNPHIAKGGYHACAHCHPDGRDDGTTWDFTDRGEGLRNTPSLEGRGGTGMGRVHWSGNFDEIQDFENDIRNAFGGSGFLSEDDWAATEDTLGEPKAGLSDELDALAAFVASLDTTPPSPFAAPDDGEALFASAGCADCHPAPLFTDSSVVDCVARHGGVDHETAVASVLLEGALENRVVAVGLRDRGLQIIEHHPDGNAPKKGPGLLKTRDQVRDLLDGRDVDVLVAAVNESDDQRVVNAPAPGFRIPHQAQPPEVDLGEFARCRLGTTYRQATPIGEAAVLDGETVKRAVGNIHALPSEELPDLGQSQPPALVLGLQPGLDLLAVGRKPGLARARRDRRQLLLPVGANYSCRSGVSSSLLLYSTEGHRRWPSALRPSPLGGGLLLFCHPVLSLGGAVARHVELSDHRVMHDPVDRSRRGHRALEDLLPLAEHQVARHDQRAALIALGDQREEHLGLVRSVLQVSEVVKDENLEVVELAQHPRQVEVSLRGQQVLDELVGRGEVHRVALLDQPVAECGHRVRLAGSRQPEREDVDRLVQEPTGRELVELLLELDRKAGLIQRVPRLARRELRGSPQAIDSPLPTVGGLELQHFEQRAERGFVIRGLEPRHHFRRHGRQAELRTQLGDLFLGRRAHRTPSASNASNTRRSGTCGVVSCGTSGFAGTARSRIVA